MKKIIAKNQILIIHKIPILQLDHENNQTSKYKYRNNKPKSQYHININHNNIILLLILYHELKILKPIFILLSPSHQIVNSIVANYDNVILFARLINKFLIFIE